MAILARIVFDYHPFHTLGRKVPGMSSASAGECPYHTVGRTQHAQPGQGMVMYDNDANAAAHVPQEYLAGKRENWEDASNWWSGAKNAESPIEIL